MPEETRRGVAKDSLESAADFVRRSSSAVRTRGERVRAERRALIEWAEKAGKVVPFSHIEQFTRVSEGAEHCVFHDAVRAVAVKATHVNRFGHSAFGEGVPATLLEYLDRLAMQNLLFGDNLRIEGVAFDEGQMEIITTQSWIVAHADMPTPSQSEIDEYFGQFGFRKVELTPGVPIYFQSDIGIIVADAHDRNILRNESGRLVPIDLVIGKPGPELLRLILEQLA